MQDTSDTFCLSSQADLAAEIAGRKQTDRLIVAIVGAPGSGKSTLSENIRDALVTAHGVTAEVVPMDGFHYDNAILDQLGLRPRKGALRPLMWMVWTVFWRALRQDRPVMWLFLCSIGKTTLPELRRVLSRKTWEFFLWKVTTCYWTRNRGINCAITLILR